MSSGSNDIRQPEIERAFATATLWLRRERQWSRIEMARRLTTAHRKYSSQMLGHVETGTHRVTLADAWAISGIFGVTPEDMIGIGNRKRTQLALAAGRWPV